MQNFGILVPWYPGSKLATHHLFWAKIDTFCPRTPIFQRIRRTYGVTHARFSENVFASVFCPKLFSRFHNKWICSVNFRQLLWKIGTFLPKFCGKKANHHSFWVQKWYFSTLVLNFFFNYGWRTTTVLNIIMSGILLPTPPPDIGGGRETGAFG